MENFMRNFRTIALLVLAFISGQGRAAEGGEAVARTRGAVTKEQQQRDIATYKTLDFDPQLFTTIQFDDQDGKSWVRAAWALIFSQHRDSVEMEELKKKFPDLFHAILSSPTFLVQLGRFPLEFEKILRISEMQQPEYTYQLDRLLKIIDENGGVMSSKSFYYATEGLDMVFNCGGEYQDPYKIKNSSGINFTISLTSERPGIIERNDGFVFVTRKKLADHSFLVIGLNPGVDTDHPFFTAQNLPPDIYLLDKHAPATNSGTQTIRSDFNDRENFMELGDRFHERFDAIYFDFSVIKFIGDRPMTFYTILRMLKKGGKLYLPNSGIVSGFFQLPPKEMVDRAAKDDKDPIYLEYKRTQMMQAMNEALTELSQNLQTSGFTVKTVHNQAINDPIFTAIRTHILNKSSAEGTPAPDFLTLIAEKP